MEIPRYFYIYINFMSWLKINIEKIYFKQSKKSETLTNPYKVLNSVTILRKRLSTCYLHTIHSFKGLFILKNQLNNFSHIYIVGQSSLIQSLRLSSPQKSSCFCFQIIIVPRPKDHKSIFSIYRFAFSGIYRCSHIIYGLLCLGSFT